MVFPKKFEIGYHFGLSNTFSDKERSEEAIARNVPSYDINGGRYNRGFEAAVMLTFPLVSLKSPKAPEPVPEPEPEPAPEPEPEKPCHTIDEMKELIRGGQDIRGKKICAIRQVNFQVLSHILTPEDKVYLDEIAALMETNDLISVRINGHSDNTGEEDFNMNLSRERAKSVHDYLLTKGIGVWRLSYAYFGPTRPIASNETEDGRAINRRVEFEIIKQ